MKRTTVLVTLALAASCQPATPSADSDPPFFDLESFFQSEIDKMSGQRAVEKTITYNLESRSEKIANWDAAKELEGMKEVNINRPAWIDQYETDTLYDGTGLVAGLRYTARDSSLRIRSVELGLEDGEVSEIQVEKRIRNLILDFDQKLSYRPGEGYRMWRVQKVPMIRRSEIEIEVRYR